ncbi:AraC family transcriptional regulator [Vibrio lamellibrachiae]|uniref:AraC family transcriptional regulator n=1 Tax=Vibrio lamellibrachiae TaxID=2910253 RepID=UPI003D1075A5
MEYKASYEPDSRVFGILDLQLLFRYMDQRLPIEDLLSDSGVSFEQLQTPETHITFAQKATIFTNALRKASEPGLGLKIGQQAKFSDFGVLGYGVLSSNTLLDALLLGFKYLRLAGPVLRKKMWVDDDTGYFRAEQIVNLDELLPFCAEYWFSAIQSLCTEVLQQPFPSTAIHLPYSKPDYWKLYEETFRCPVFFDSDRMEWQFNTKDLVKPLPTANPMTLKMCLKSCDEMIQSAELSSPLSNKITRMLFECTGRFPSIEDLSSQLNMSSRTLRRHLRAEDTSFQALLNHVRYNLACRYLSTTQMSVEEISERLGFSDDANFRHAFRKWSQTSPSQYRKGATKES